MAHTSFEACSKTTRHDTSLLLAALLAWGASTLPAHAQEIQQTTQPQAQQTPPPARPPFPNRLNEVLPRWLRARGEFRDRMEGFTNAEFISDRDDLYWLNRFRLNATIQPSRLLAFSVQAQDARVQKKTVGSTGPPFRDVFDLRMAFADVGDPQQSPFLVRVGRQEFAFGEQRLVGHLSWLNTARTFDAVRLTIRRKKFQVDAFGSSVVTVQDAKFNRSGFGSRFFGAYGSANALVPQSTIEPYVFYRLGRGLKSERGPVGDLKAATIGARWVGKLPARLDYGTEVAVQTGSLGPDTVRAWAGHWQVRDTLSTKHGLRLVGEYNYASGDSDPLDGKRETFDQLYPTGHDKYGLADQVGWRNIHHLRSGLEVTPRQGLVVNGSYHSWWLAETRDGLYNAGGAVIAQVPGGAADRHVGQEIDAQASYALSAQVQVGGGYAHIFPGKFLKRATPGSAYGYPYVMVTYIFLAER